MMISKKTFMLVAGLGLIAFFFSSSAKAETVEAGTGSGSGGGGGGGSAEKPPSALDNLVSAIGDALGGGSGNSSPVGSPSVPAGIQNPKHKMSKAERDYQKAALSDKLVLSGVVNPDWRRFRVDKTGAAFYKQDGQRHYSADTLKPTVVHGQAANPVMRPTIQHGQAPMPVLYH